MGIHIYSFNFLQIVKKVVVKRALVYSLWIVQGCAKRFVKDANYPLLQIQNDIKNIDAAYIDL